MISCNGVFWMQHQPSRLGFSLLEASIVLVLVGLVAGIIMMVSTIERHQKLRSVMTDAQTYSTALWQFYQKYGSLPGDMPNATQVWGTADTSVSAGSDCSAPATNSIMGKTCNGNADGFIKIVDATSSCEPYRAWEQLMLAGAISGTYTGVSGLTTCAANSVAEVNSPKSTIEGATFTFNSLGEIAGADLVYYPGNYNNALFFGGQRANDFSIYPILTPAEAHEIDGKGDDGDPTIGKIRNTRNGSGKTPNCTKNNMYDESQSNPLCAVIFMSDLMRKTDQQ